MGFDGIYCSSLSWGFQCEREELWKLLVLLIMVLLIDWELSSNCDKLSSITMFLFCSVQKESRTQYEYLTDLINQVGNDTTVKKQEHQTVRYINTMSSKQYTSGNSLGSTTALSIVVFWSRTPTPLWQIAHYGIMDWLSRLHNIVQGGAENNVTCLDYK